METENPSLSKVDLLYKSFGQKSGMIQTLIFVKILF